MSRLRRMDQKEVRSGSDDSPPAVDSRRSSLASVEQRHGREKRGSIASIEQRYNRDKRSSVPFRRQSLPGLPRLHRDSVQEGFDLIREKNGQNIRGQLTAICSQVDSILHSYTEDGDLLEHTGREQVEDIEAVNPVAVEFQVKGIADERDELKSRVKSLRERIEMLTLLADDLREQNQHLSEEIRRKDRTEALRTQLKQSVEAQTDDLAPEPSSPPRPLLLPSPPARETGDDPFAPEALLLQQASPKREDNIAAIAKYKLSTLPSAPREAAPVASRPIAFASVVFDNEVFQRLLTDNPSDVLRVQPTILALIRSVYTPMGGYELQTVASKSQEVSGLDVTVAFANVLEACQFANKLQLELVGLPWSVDVLSNPYSGVKTLPDGEVLWRGIPLGIVVHSGVVTSDFDPTLKRMRYKGADLQVLQRMKEVVRPGETLLSSHVFTCAGPALGAEQAVVRRVDKLDGCLQMLPAELAHRKFTGLPAAYDVSKASGVTSPTLQPLPPPKPVKKSSLPNGIVTFVFLEVPDSKKLWTADPDAMEDATRILRRISCRLLAEHAGVEVRSFRDASKIAFFGPADAIAFCIELQVELHGVEWPERVMFLPGCKKKFDTAGASVLWSGIRVRAAIHRGPVVFVENPTTGDVDYSGPATVIAAKLCDVAGGGQTLITEQTLAYAGVPTVALSSSRLPSVTFQGLTAEYPILELYPAKLAKRKMYLSELRTPGHWSCGSAESRRELVLSVDILQKTALLVGCEDLSRETRNDAECAERALEASATGPPGPTPAPFARVSLVFLDVAQSEELWEADFETMGAAVNVYKTLVEDTARRYRGYMAGQYKECFSVAFHDEKDAVLFALDVQEALPDAPWPAKLADNTLCREVCCKATGRRLWRGLRVCVGCHHGAPICLPHPSTGKVDYWGTNVFKGLSVGALAVGGEVLATASAWYTAQAGVRAGLGPTGEMPLVEEFPAVLVGDIKEPMHLIRLTPRKLADRSFPAVALESRDRRSHWRSSAYAERSRMHTAREIMSRIASLFSSGIPAILGDELPTIAGAPVGSVTLVFTDVQSSTSLWEKNATVMLQSIQLHNDIMRETIVRHNGYEVKTEGDAFMVAFHREIDAALFCLDAQKELVKAPWPPDLLQLDPLTAPVLAPAGRGVAVDGKSYLWRGLRMRIGAHCGAPTCLPDPVSGRMDYWGPMVNKSARIAAVATGGQVVLSTPVYERSKDALEAYGAAIKDLSSFELKGISGKTQIYETLPCELEGRDFGKVKAASSPPKKKDASKDASPLISPRRKHGAVPPLSSEATVGRASLVAVREKLSQPNTLVKRNFDDHPPSEASCAPSPPTEAPPVGGTAVLQARRESYSSDGSVCADADGGIDDFVWTSDSCKYVDVDRIAHAAAINRLIAGGIMDPEPSALPSNPNSAALAHMESFAVLRRQMQEDSCTVSLTAIPSVSSFIKKSIVSPRRASARQPQPPAGPRQFSKKPALPDTAKTAMSPPIAPRAPGHSPAPRGGPRRLSADVSARSAASSSSRSPRTGSAAPSSPARRPASGAERKLRGTFNEDTPLGSIVSGLNSMTARLHKKREQLRLQVEEMQAVDENDCKELETDEFIQATLQALVEQIERERMEQEDWYFPADQQATAAAPFNLSKPTSASAKLSPVKALAKVSRTVIAVNRWISRKSRPLDIWDEVIEVQSYSQRNERLGFTLLHHQIARLHIKVKALYESFLSGDLTDDARNDFWYQCLLCVNPHEAKTRHGNIREALAHFTKDIITQQDANRRIGVTHCRSSIIGMVLQWAVWLASMTSSNGAQSFDAFGSMQADSLPGSPKASPVALPGASGPSYPAATPGAVLPPPPHSAGSKRAADVQFPRSMVKVSSFKRQPLDMQPESPIATAQIPRHSVDEHLVHRDSFTYEPFPTLTGRRLSKG